MRTGAQLASLAQHVDFAITQPGLKSVPCPEMQISPLAFSKWCLSANRCTCVSCVLIFVCTFYSPCTVCLGVYVRVVVLYLRRPVKFPFKAVWSGRALSACHRGQHFIRTAALRPPRRAQELKHMCKLNRHPNSLTYTKQFKWYSLERWQVLMSLSVLWRERERLRDRVRGWRTLRFFLCFPPISFLSTVFRGHPGVAPINVSWFK